MNPVYYDVYEGDTLFLQCVTREEVNKALNINKKSLTSYAHSEWKLKGKYRIYPTGEKGIKKIQGFPEAWEEAIKPFRRVIWCKGEGKKLKVRKRAGSELERMGSDD